MDKNTLYLIHNLILNYQFTNSLACRQAGNNQQNHGNKKSNV